MGTACCEKTFPASCKGHGLVGRLRVSWAYKTDLVSIRLIRELCREEEEEWGRKIPRFCL